MHQLISLKGNSQKLDGGAMFGHVPKALWSQWITPDDKNRISLACRALLIREPHKNVLLEAGVGAFFEPALRERYGVEEPHHVLLDSLQQAGLSHTDIDIVVLSHLHFDHAGGLLSAWQEGKAPSLLFPNARYLVSKAGWERACHPHMRDRASFVPALNVLLNASQRLVIVDDEKCDLLGDDYRFSFTNGHTPGLMHTIVNVPDEDPVIFASDLIPGSFWVHLPVAMGYDRSAELLIDEKKAMLEFAVRQQARLFYTHDPAIALSSIKEEKGKYLPVNGVAHLPA
ncbi:MBL fold metallo-hydrolase [Aquicella lusitana]|uniref:Glyoxylase-like metal-dependent hydrolase (Beta-lactamase superfamily II) n=1 Tax=Aquicella lusitana TaxID=254246 RepID=A0A370GN41_9COXI|nr:MBL fold metallo-hydrolase [Aquicella lusitana]RDI45152.1 glyoxylase-like metal-dependent hydrolase (beta-lactamase superfamily II) [Aquicella lusitana]VVC72778.1 putative quorum-quenching lactonase YtnP [Aquicella lusitana]